MASQSDGKKRRSFLPAPKKSGASPTSPQNASFSLLQQPDHKTFYRQQQVTVALETSQVAENLNQKPYFGRGLRVGARVKIGGVKPGILRYLGTTHLAPGIFCGIELLDPAGVHDGEVNGHRYFACSPFHGIFAPKEKVCLDQAFEQFSRLGSDSDQCYSSTESLSEKSNQALKRFEEDDLIAVDCTLLKSPAVSPNSSHSVQKLPHDDLPRTNLSTTYELINSEHKDVLTHARRAKSSTFIVSSSDSPADSQSDTVLTKTFSGSAKEREYISENLVSRQSIQSNDYSELKSSEDSEDSSGGVRDSKDTLSTGIKKQLRADSRQYLNFTFDSDNRQRDDNLSDSFSDSDVKRSEDTIPSTSIGSNSLSDVIQPFEDVRSNEQLDYFCTSTPEPTSRIEGKERNVLSSKSFTIEPRQVCYENPELSFESSEDSELRGSFSLTCSISESEILPALPAADRIDYIVTCASETKVSQGGYDRIPVVGGGSKERLCGSPGLCSTSSLSYTVCAETSPKSRSTLSHNHSLQKDPGEEKRVMSSSSYTIAKTDTSTSTSPSHRPRNSSSDSLSHEDSSSSGEPKTESSESSSKCENVDDTSIEASPEVSQTLEWDYGQEFEGKIPLAENTMTISTSTGTSESLSEVLNDVSDSIDPLEKNEGHLLAEDSDQFEQPDNEFENIDSLEDFPIFGKDPKATMTDSGISEKEFGLTKSTCSTICGSSSDDWSRDDDVSINTMRAPGSDSSQETILDTPCSVEEKDLPCDDICRSMHSSNCQETYPQHDDSFEEINSPASVISLTDGKVNQNTTFSLENVDETNSLHEDNVMSRCTERPASLVSTTSADTGYAPDAEFELGTSNSPTELRQYQQPTVSQTFPRDSKLPEDKTQEQAELSVASKQIDDEEACTSLTVGSEDDRIEADQVYDSENVTSSSPGTHSVTDNNRSRSQSVSEDTRSEHNSSISEEAKEKVDEPAKDVKLRVKKEPKKKRVDLKDHKMPNIKVASKLADYIKTPVPTKPKEDKSIDEKKNVNKVMKNNAKNRRTSLETPNHRAASVERGKVISRENSVERNRDNKKQEKPKQVIKRTPPKSKWGNIMSQIENNKDQAKPKPKSEIRSSLAAYITSSTVSSSNTGDNSVKATPKRPSRIKELPPPPPKIDFSKIKSKLNVPTASSVNKSAPKRESSPAISVHSRSSSPVSTTSVTKDKLRRKSSLANTDGNIVLIRQPSQVSLKSSRTDVSVVGKDGGNNSQAPTRQRRQSTHSTTSDALAKKPARNGREITHDIKQVERRKNYVVQQNKKDTPGLSRTKDKRPVSGSGQKEVERLASLCETRTKELTHVKMQLRSTCQAFDALSVLVNYCCSELNAFDCPLLARRLEVTQKQLQSCLSQIDELKLASDQLSNDLSNTSRAKEEAERRADEARERADKEREQHETIQKEMDCTHNAALTAQRDELTVKHQESVKKLKEQQEEYLRQTKDYHCRQVADMKNELKMEMNGLKIAQLEEIQALRNKHDLQMEELHKQHRNKLEDITLRFESIKLTLSEKVESLRLECDELRKRARLSEEALQRDADVKVQMALAPYLPLPQEIDSLKTVVDMKNEDIQKLRQKNMDIEKQLEEIPIAREKVISLQQKVENLEAIINIKTDHEKQLHEKCQILMRKYDKESRANKRLSMDYEQVMWKMSQSSEFGSCESLTKRQVSRSPPRSDSKSPDPHRRNYSPGTSEVKMRVKNNSDSKMRTRSATFILDKDEKSEERSSPRPSSQNRKTKSACLEPDFNVDGRMCVSAGPESITGDIAQSESPILTCKFPHLSHDDSSMTSSAEMVSSYAKSESGVSDSGLCDSLSRSEILNSSLISTDSDWVNSMNISGNFDSTIEDASGEANQDVTVTHVSSGPAASQDPGDVDVQYDFQVSVSSADKDSRDDVFDETYSLGSSLSLDQSESRLASISEDFQLEESSQ